MPPQPSRQLAASKQQAQSLFQKGQFKQACTLYEKLCRKHPNDAELTYMLGSVYGQLGKFEEATRSFRTCIELQPNAFVAHCGLGAALKGLGQYAEAEQSFREALKLQPGNPDVILELAISLLRQDKLEESQGFFQQVLKSGSDSAEALHSLGEIRHATRRYEEAIDFYQRALKIAPDRAGTHNRIGHAQFMLGLYDEAIPHFREAVRIIPDFAEAYKNMGSALMTAGNAEAARKALQQALQLRPDYTDALVCEINLYEQEGDPEGAYERLARLVQRNIEHPGLATTFINICRHVERCDEAIVYAERVLENNHLPAATELMVQFALGKLHDRLENYDKAFLHYQRGNELKPDTFNEVEHTGIIDALTRVFSWQFLATAPRATVRSERPVFIVGMPRSGTSLTEQILASHPMVFGAGELMDVGNMVTALPGLVGKSPSYPFNLARLTPAILDDFAQKYLDHLAALDPGAPRVTDKMPQNFLHLGLIALAFPDARVIHCVRDPRDTCLSIYFQNFNEAHNYANKLEDVGRYYRQYEKLMQHYKGLLNIQIMEVQYEDLVANQENLTRQLLDFAGLDWDDRCLEFNKTRRFVATSSYDQVRQGMYTRSAGRWKHYEHNIGPLLDVLGR